MLSKTKQIGTVGELAVAQDLIQRGWDVYMSVGDCTKIDIVSIKGDVIKRHQVKTIVKSETGVVCIGATKIISRKRVSYEVDDFDYLPVYVIDRDRIAYVPMNIIHGRSMTLQFDVKRNSSRARNFNEFENF